MKKSQNTQQQLEIDAGLDAESRRVMQRAREIFGVEELTAETAPQAAKNIAQRLAKLEGDVRLADQNRILALMGSVNDLKERLSEEKSNIGMRLVQQNKNKTANLAYAQGVGSCLRK